MASASAKEKRRGKTRTLGVFAEIQHKGSPHKLAPADHMELMPLLKARDTCKLLHFSATYYFNQELWLKSWHAAIAKSDFAVIKSLRLFIQLNTIHASQLGAYFLPEGTKVGLPKDMVYQSVRGTQRYDCAPQIPNEPATPLDTNFQVVNEDCLVAAMNLVDQGLDPAVLVLASAYNPGGGYMAGAGAQEENLCRRTCLWQCLDDPLGVCGERKLEYPIPEFGAFYSPKVLVFRGSEKAGYPYLAAPVRMGFINSAAYRDPPVQTGKAGDTRLSGKVIGKYLQKIRTIFSVAIEQGHDSVVLSAYGCGAYLNPPRHIAELFYEVLMSPSFRHSFKVVCFAILDDHNAHKSHNPEGNFKPFKDVFEKMK